MMTKSQILSPFDRRLRPNPWNTNHVSPVNEAKLDEAIKRLGIFKPIIVREFAESEDLEILGGEHRWQGAQRLKLKELPVMNLGIIDDKKAKEISLADNARFGTDDTLALSELMKDIGGETEWQKFLPYTDDDLKAIFSSADIALDELELDSSFDKNEEKDEAPEPAPPKAPKTHTIMRFKVSLADAERLTEMIAQTQRDHGLTAEDDATNAGDALVHLLLGSSGV